MISDPRDNSISNKIKPDSNMESKALQYLNVRRGRRIGAWEKPLKNALDKVITPDKNNKTGKLKEIQRNWNAIIGENLAKICYPEKINGKTLTLRANSSAAALLQMRSNEILGTVSLAIGTNLGKLNLIQAPLKKGEKSGKIAQNIISKPLDAAEQAAIEDKIKDIDSPTLKRAIMNLSTLIKNID